MNRWANTARISNHSIPMALYFSPKLMQYQPRLHDLHRWATIGLLRELEDFVDGYISAHIQIIQSETGPQIPIQVSWSYAGDANPELRQACLRCDFQILRGGLPVVYGAISSSQTHLNVRNAAEQTSRIDRTATNCQNSHLLVITKENEKLQAKFYRVWDGREPRDVTGLGAGEMELHWVPDHEDANREFNLFLHHCVTTS